MKIVNFSFIFFVIVQFQSFALENKTIVSDVSGMNAVLVDSIIKPTRSNQIVSAIKNSKGKISIGGGRYSMGGQIAYRDSLHIDMRQFNKIIDFDKDAQTITVQSGATWRDVQNYIDPYNLSISIMQSYANFTLGGSLSVNAHGRYIGTGSLIESVTFIKVILANGENIFANRNQNSDIFYAVIGGYGALGVITEVGLKLVKNSKINRKTTLLKTEDYIQYFAKNINNNSTVVLQNGNLYPPDYNEILSIVWHKTDKKPTVESRLTDKNTNYFFTKKLTEFIADYEFGKSIRKNIIDPIRYLGSPVVWRNYEASHDVLELPDNHKDKVYALREYFIPVEKFGEFITQMKEIFIRNQTNIINVSIRHVKADNESLLSWATTEVFSFVVYYRQKIDKKSIAQVKKWSLEMLDTTLKLGGSYYLPYQIFATNEQFNLAYQNAGKFFTLKHKLDKNNRFNNQLWDKYYPPNQTSN
jgi:FAD/FMN-containing dehydrogenase